MLFPLLGGLFSALFGRRVSRWTVERVACAGVILSFIMALIAFDSSGGKHQIITFFTWFQVADFSVLMDVRFDPLAAFMALTVTFVSSLIHIYSVGYMKHDEGYVRYFCYLNLFVFSMLVITLADNLVFLFLGWEGVGFCSYGLIGFWYKDMKNASAGRKAFLLTRIGDVAFGIAIGLFFLIFNSLSITYINGHADILTPGTMTLFGLLLLWAAAGKSAQLPLSVWLPDAMAGPTPVSALIHAATMVTAGVYLLMRLFPVFSGSATAMAFIAVAGTLTAFYGACAALMQGDIKRVLAYSTISQLGYMFLAVGAGNITAGMFHLVTHAFFKALLFLAAGCVIHALHEEQNIFRMGKKLRLALPGVYWPFLAGAAALSALPPTAGFFSKDEILISTFLHAGIFYKFLWFIAILTAALTALYTFRLFFIVFTGESLYYEEESEKSVEKPPPNMIATLWPLGVLAIFAGLLNLPAGWGGGGWLSEYFLNIPGAAHHGEIPHSVENGMAIASAVIGIFGIICAWFLYGPKGLLRRPDLPGAWGGLFDLLREAFYLDWLYRRYIAWPFEKMADILWNRVDREGIDRGLYSFANTFMLFSQILREWTSGRLSGYLFMLFMGLTVILCLLAINFSIL